MVLVLLSLTLVGLGVFLHTMLGHRLHDDLQARLTDRAQIARGLDAQLSGQALADRLSTADIRVTIGTGSRAIQGRPTPGQAAPAARPDPHDRPGRPKPIPGSVGPVVHQGELLSITDQLPNAGTVTLQVSAAPIDSLLRRLVGYEVLGSVLVLVLAGAACGGLVRFALRPLDRMTALAQASARGRRGERLDPVRKDTELGRTAAAFDAMLDGLEHSAAQARSAEHQLRRFLGDASHELRTPIAALQATAETLLREKPDAAEREQLTVAAVRAARRAGRLVDDLLLMARADEGATLPLRREGVDLAGLAQESLQRARFLAPDLEVVLQCPPGLAVWGDPDRLSQILDNLSWEAPRAISRPTSTCGRQSAGCPLGSAKRSGCTTTSTSRSRRPPHLWAARSEP
jgi:two-component system, OmpR family, sensor kinase